MAKTLVFRFVEQSFLLFLVHLLLSYPVRWCSAQSPLQYSTASWQKFYFHPHFTANLFQTQAQITAPFTLFFLVKYNKSIEPTCSKPHHVRCFFFFLVVFTRTYQQTWLLCMRLHVECNNVHNPRKESLQHLCPRKLITVVRCRKAIYRITRRLHICAGQPCVTCCAPLNMHGQQGPQHLKIIERNQLL